MWPLWFIGSLYRHDKDQDDNLNMFPFMTSLSNPVMPFICRNANVSRACRLQADASGLAPLVAVAGTLLGCSYEFKYRGQNCYYNFKYRERTRTCALSGVRTVGGSAKVSMGRRESY